MLRDNTANATPATFISREGRRLMRSRCEDLVGIRDLARNYKDVERYLGQYTFEDFLNFCLIYSKYIFQVRAWPLTTGIRGRVWQSLAGTCNLLCTHAACSHAAADC